MFVPPYHLLLEASRPTGTSAREDDEVTIPRALLELMLRLLVEQMPFDEEDYLRRNPDVATAIAAGKLESAHQHFVAKGYFEGRVGGAPKVDEAWYRQRYTDVAKEISSGGITSGSDHYAESGAREWRSPSLAALALTDSWKQAASAPATNVATPSMQMPEEYLRALRRRG